MKNCPLIVQAFDYTLMLNTAYISLILLLISNNNKIFRVIHIFLLHCSVNKNHSLPHFLWSRESLTQLTHTESVKTKLITVLFSVNITRD